MQGERVVNSMTCTATVNIDLSQITLRYDCNKIVKRPILCSITHVLAMDILSNTPCHAAQENLYNVLT